MADEFEQAVQAPEVTPPAEQAVEQQPPSEESAPAETVDTLRERLAAVTKERNDWKAKASGNIRADERFQNLRQGITQDISPELQSLRDTVNVLVKRFGADDEGLQNELNVINERQASQAQTRAATEAVYNGFATSLTKALKDTGLDAAAPELATARETWAKARQNNNDAAGFTEALRLIYDAAAKKNTPPAPTEEQPKPDLDMATTQSSGSSASPEEVWRQYGRGQRQWSDPDVQRAGRTLGHI